MTPVWKRRQKRAYEMMWRDAARKRRRERFIAGPFGWVAQVPNMLMSWPVVMGLIVLFSLVMVVRSLAADERQIRRDCRMDALTYCKVAIVTTDRMKIINCMLQHKDKLQPKCSRHLY